MNELLRTLLTISLSGGILALALFALAPLVRGRMSRRWVELWENVRIASPLLMGFARPRVVLPDSGLPPGELRMTLLHELRHLRRRDLLFKLLVRAAVCVHWFNPLVRRMEREIGRLCELSCDEAVLRRLNAEERRSYGDTLLGALRAGGGVPGTAELSEDARLLKERLGEIMKFTDHADKKARAIAAAALTGILCTAAAASGVPARGETPHSSAPDIPNGTTTELEVRDLSAHRMELSGAPSRAELRRIDAGTLGMEFTGSDAEADDVTVRQAFGATSAGGSMRVAGDLRCDVTLVASGPAAVSCTITNGDPDDYSVYGGILLPDGRIGVPSPNAGSVFYPLREDAPSILHLDSDGDPGRSLEVFFRDESDKDAGR